MVLGGIRWGFSILAGLLATAMVVAGALVVLVGGLASNDSEQSQQTFGSCANQDAGIVPIANTNGGQTGQTGLGTEGTAAQGVVPGLDADQVAIARTIIAAGKQLGVPAYGWVIAIAAGLQESGLRNLPGGDRDSVGVFQQRPSAGWGNVAQIMVPANAALAFFGRSPYTHNTGLLEIPGWQKMQVTAAAQAVQRSGFPLAYAAHEAQARQIVQALAPEVSAADLGATPTSIECTSGVAGLNTAVVMPVPAGSYVDQDNYGGSGSHWASIHTGDDLAAPCGTPALAATSGTVLIKSGGGWAWAGNWLVQVQTAPGQLTTWYAHMRKLDVVNGQQVSAGQQIGEVGDLGNAFGCHLHFEVHPYGGGYLQDQVDPHDWLAKNVGQTLEGPSGAGQTGASQTGAGQPPAGGATGRAVRFVQANIKISLPRAKMSQDLAKVVATAPDFISLNEVNSRTDAQITPAGYRMYRAPIGAGGSRSATRETAVLWRADRWTPIAQGTVQLTRPVNGRRLDWRYATYVTLAGSDGTGKVSVVSAHTMVNPRYDRGDARKHEDQRGFARLAGLAQALQASGPVLVAGDLNAQYPRHGGKGAEWWGPKPLMDQVGMPSTFELLGAPPQGWKTHDGGGVIDWIFESSATLAAADQATFALNSDHRALLSDFTIRTQ